LNLKQGIFPRIRERCEIGYQDRDAPITPRPIPCHLSASHLEIAER
jgi:hypothetical protein